MPVGRVEFNCSLLSPQAATQLRIYFSATVAMLCSNPIKIQYLASALMVDNRMKAT